MKKIKLLCSHCGESIPVTLVGSNTNGYCVFYLQKGAVIKNREKLNRFYSYCKACASRLHSKASCSISPELLAELKIMTERIEGWKTLTIDSHAGNSGFDNTSYIQGVIDGCNYAIHELQEYLKNKGEN